VGTKIDFRKTLKYLYNPSKIGFHIVDVQSMNFLMINGVGDPNTSEKYTEAIEYLYSMSYGLKFALKSQGVDHIVPPLEGLWWMENMGEFTMENKYRWKWTMMIMQPEWVTTEWVEKVKTDVIRKKRLTSLSNIKFETYDEGLSVQILYTGPYDKEASTIAEMHNFIKSNGYQKNGKHHEVYIGDVRKTPPEKLQTILRQPIRKE
jgi:hypothetical protein